MSYDNNINIDFMSYEDRKALVFDPLKKRIYDVVLSYHGEMYEQGFAGYPGSSQSLNIDNPFDAIAESLATYALKLLQDNDLGIMVPGEDEDDQPSVFSELGYTRDEVDAVFDWCNQVDENSEIGFEDDNGVFITNVFLDPTARFEYSLRDAIDDYGIDNVRWFFSQVLKDIGAQPLQTTAII